MKFDVRYLENCYVNECGHNTDHLSPLTSVYLIHFFILESDGTAIVNGEGTTTRLEVVMDFFKILRLYLL
jgi:hypothetical protein